MNHETYIKRCLQIAKNGIGFARPNPSVGAVVVHQNKIIGEGFTAAYGGNHAEVNAINAVKDTSLLKEATIYVTLEPCSHFGKTPPCADLIVKHQLKNVVIGCVDSNSLVAGKGIERLEKAGINVTVGVLEDECREHHKRFFTVQDKKRLYIILKWAETKDGFVAPLTKDEQKPVWISNQYSQQLVHKWRSEEHAILVGTNTVIADNPKLNVRSWSGQNPIRIVLDRTLRLSNNLSVFDGSVKTIFITEKQECQFERSRELIFESINFSKNIASQICEVLMKHQIQSVIIEGGSKTLQTFIDENLWDEARVFVGETELKEGIKAPKFNKVIKEEINIKTDVLKIYTND
ncbi:bifunctional diaminohydroxyphosphoribosylaminopyrimidine deaminase/5-amino-6-(5-phosphoribosylamino)uracil reductase RibD [Polaribacter sp. Hel1_85]|uniref:bifunctional diaminohydroxyphosphoribosylaminopyrimidine deaminase/5-amino-6-(5-phosphoribosylamino)uracil reductase RibD n=1 Tax=Polaribacter sp. Hel1_85 TaxID=1250005 RepID=UPI00055F6FFC|nr:bifunctional diaminohydroxyphosphoribosylaminopyrimidine deaminase/5-amino-6-(5-phosphoribosylamino)uracil reductase RibD [Polaribacter sp. Hel1_85]